MTAIPLKKSAQSVQEFFHQHNLDCKVLELSESTKTAEMAAENIGCTLGQITKSLIFKTKNSHQPILVLASGPNRVDEKIIKAHVGENIKKADADFTRDVTGFAIGGIPPFAHKNKIDHIFIDEDLLNFDVVWAAAGTPNAVFDIQTKDLIPLTAGKIISLKI